MSDLIIIKEFKNTQPRMTKAEKLAYSLGFGVGTIKRVAKSSATIIKEDYSQLMFDLKTF